MEEYKFMYGSPVKAKDNGDGTMTVSGLGIVYDDPKKPKKDLVGEFFTKNTYLGKSRGDGVDGMFHHSFPVLYERKWTNEHYLIPKEAYDFAKGLAKHRFKNAVNTKDAEDGSGLIATVVLNMRNEYEKFIAKLAAKGALGWSSGALSHAGEINWKTGEIKEWIIGEFSLTPTPAEPRAGVNEVKSLVNAPKMLEYFKELCTFKGDWGEFGTESEEEIQELALHSELMKLKQLVRYGT